MKRAKSPVFFVMDTQNTDVLATEFPAIFQFLDGVATHRMKLEKGTYVFREHEGCGRIGFVLSGSIRVVKEHDSGRNITLYRIGPGDSCILSMSCALSNPIHQASAIVEENAEVLSVSTEDFRTLIERSHDARDYVFSIFATRLTDVMLLVEEIVFHRMDQRLAGILIENSARHHTDTVVATHEQLAEEAGTAREVVTRILRDFSARGLVEVHRGSVKITDRKGLLLVC